MRISMKYFAQVRQAAGVPAEKVEVPEGADVAAAIRRAADHHEDSFRTLVLTDDARVRPSLLLLVNEETAHDGAAHPLAEGDEVSVFSPVAGG